MADDSEPTSDPGLPEDDSDEPPTPVEILLYLISFIFMLLRMIFLTKNSNGARKDLVNIYS